MNDFLKVMNEAVFHLIRLRVIEEHGFEPKHLIESDDMNMGENEIIVNEAKKYFKNCCEILGLEEFKTEFTQEEAELLRFNGMIVNEKCVVGNKNECLSGSECLSQGECLLETKANKKEPVSLQERFNILHNTGMVNSELEKERQDRQNNWRKK